MEDLIKQDLINELIKKEKIINKEIDKCKDNIPCLIMYLPLAISYMETRNKLIGLTFKEKITLKKLKAFKYLYRKKITNTLSIEQQKKLKLIE